MPPLRVSVPVRENTKALLSCLPLSCLTVRKFWTAKVATMYGTKQERSLRKGFFSSFGEGSEGIAI
jgi:hypothetical protein